MNPVHGVHGCVAKLFVDGRLRSRHAGYDEQIAFDDREVLVDLLHGDDDVGPVHVGAAHERSLQLLDTGRHLLGRPEAQHLRQRQHAVHDRHLNVHVRRSVLFADDSNVTELASEDVLVLTKRSRRFSHLGEWGVHERFGVTIATLPSCQRRVPLDRVAGFFDAQDVGIRRPGMRLEWEKKG